MSFANITLMFKDCVKANPNSTAITTGTEKLTYNDVDQKSDVVCNFLLNQGVVSDDIIGIVGKYSPNIMIAILGILKSGAAYLPLDPDYPSDRIEHICLESKMKAALSWDDCNIINDLGLDTYYIEDIFNVKPEQPKTCCKDIGSTDLAYVIYTSGSSGKPKGVMISHNAVKNFVDGISECVEFSAGKSIACVTTMSFDIFFVEAILPLLKGMRIVMLEDKDKNNPEKLLEYIELYKLNMLQVTPSRLQMLLEIKESKNILKRLSDILVGGEAFPENLFLKLKQITSSDIFNLYGPTEATIWISSKNLTSKSYVSIGDPFINNSFYILDKTGSPVTDGEIGELYISGLNLADGYYMDPKLTESSFSRFFKGSDELMYKTGDLVKKVDGNIKFVGREDTQIKIRGYRVELGDIEHVLRKKDSVKQCVVNLIKNSKDISFLCCYYTCEENLTASELKDYSSKNLPSYMVPDIFVKLDNFPKTPNGKIDRNSIISPLLNTKEKSDINHNNVEETLSLIWTDITEVNQFSLNDPIFDIGGNSISIAKFCSEINDEYNLNLSLIDIFNYSTLKKISNFIKSQI